MTEGAKAFSLARRGMFLRDLFQFCSLEHLWGEEKGQGNTVEDQHASSMEVISPDVGLK